MRDFEGSHVHVVETNTNRPTPFVVPIIHMGTQALFIIPLVRIILKGMWLTSKGNQDGCAAFKYIADGTCIKRESALGQYTSKVNHRHTYCETHSLTSNTLAGNPVK